MTELTIEALCSKDKVLTEFLTHPVIANKKSATVEQGLKAAANVVENTVIERVMTDVEAAINEAYETHCMLHGDPEDIDDTNADDWHSACDDAVDEALQPWAGILSADWLGRKTVDTRLDEQGAISELAKSAGVEAYKQMCSGRKPGQILSAVGVVKADIEAAMNIQAEQGIDVAAIRSGAIDTLVYMLDAADMVGEVPDVMEVYDELDLMSDTDDGLAMSAAERMGCEAEHVNALRLFRETVGIAGLDALAEMYSALSENRDAYANGEAIPAFDEAVAEQPAPAKKAAPKKAAAKKADKTEPPAGDALNPEVLALLKAHANVKDKDVAEKIGMSRATFNNKVNGKGDPIDDAEQIALIREILMEHCNGLIRAVHLLDGTEPTSA